MRKENQPRRLRAGALAAALLLAFGAAPVSAADGGVGGVEDVAEVPPVKAAERAADLPECRADWAAHVASMTGHRRGGAVSAWLDNGVRVHWLRLDSSPGAVWITISLIGGELREHAGDRGVSLGACSAWDGLSTTGLAPTRIVDAMAGRDLHIDAAAGQDVLQLRLWGRARDIEEGVRVAAALMTHGRVTAATLDAAREAARTRARERESHEESLVGEAIARLMFPASDPRLHPVTGPELDAVTVDAAQRCLDDHVARAPVEVAVVGDISLDEAVRLAAGYLGDLPARERVTPARDLAARTLPPAHYPLVGTLVRPIAPGSAIVVAGFAGADAARPAELRTLRVAARILDDRATAALRQAGFEQAEVGAAAIPATIYPGYGVVVASFKCAPGGGAVRAEQAADVMMKAITRLAEEGVTADEVKPVAEDLARAVDQIERQGRYWSMLLSRCDAVGLDVDDAADGAAFYRSIKAESVSAAIRSHAANGRTLRLIIVPSANP